MRFRLRQFAFAASVILSLSTSTSRAQNAPAAAPAATAGSPSAEPVLASYRGGAITLAEYERIAATKVKQVRLLLATSDDRKRELLESMIEFELLLQEAKRRGFAEHHAVKVAMREAEVKALIQGQLTVTPESIPKADVEAEYKKRAAEFSRPERRRARHAVLASEAEATALIAEARKNEAKANELVARAARERSLDDATKSQGGELGFFLATGERIGIEGTLPPELAKAAFALGKNERVVPKPIAFEGGFSVLVVSERVPATSIEPSVALETVRSSLAEQRSREALDAEVAELQKARPVEKHIERADWVTLDPPASADIPHGFPAAPRDPTAPPVLTEPDGF